MNAIISFTLFWRIWLLLFLGFHFPFQVQLFFVALLLHQPELLFSLVHFLQMVHSGESICRLSVLSSHIRVQEQLLILKFNYLIFELFGIVFVFSFHATVLLLEILCSIYYVHYVILTSI